MNSFLLENELFTGNVNHETADRLMRASFNDLGLDFMRQHYRRLKDESIASASIPDNHLLQESLNQVQHNRTTDSDWQLKR